MFDFVLFLGRAQSDEMGKTCSRVCKTADGCDARTDYIINGRCCNSNSPVSRGSVIEGWVSGESVSEIGKSAKGWAESIQLYTDTGARSSTESPCE